MYAWASIYHGELFSFRVNSPLIIFERYIGFRSAVADMLVV